ncbi:MAG: Nucleotidyl transferase [Anaerocolumna sp.]|nr:Nucleotidyl transferase [Anaerocolumna sp.]
MRLEDFIVSDEDSVLQVMQIIDRNTKGIAFVCENGNLLAVVTDGDIRRFIIHNGDINSFVKEIANYQPKFVYQDELINYDNYMKEYSITAVPIISRERRLLSIRFLLDGQAIKKRNVNAPVVIMAGGKGTRLYPYTQILPKPLIPVGDKTITELIMDRFEAFDCNHFDLIVNYKKNFIKSFFLDNEVIRDVAFIEEKEFYGTGGGLKLLEGKYTEPFFMTNCDILVEEDYYEIMNTHIRDNNIITIVAAAKNITIPYGTIQVSDEGRVEQLKEKPSFSFLTNTGFYVISPEFLKQIPENTFIHITDIIQSCIQKGEKVGIYPINERSWMDMGQLEELEKMRERLEEDARKT